MGEVLSAGCILQIWGKMQTEGKVQPTGVRFDKLRVRFFGRIRKWICDSRSYGFFDTKETQNPKKDYFVMRRQAGGMQYICQNNTSLVLP